MDKGVLYVAYGKQAIEQWYVAMRHLSKRYGWPVSVISESPMPPAAGLPRPIHLPFPDHDDGARWAKLHMDELSPFDKTLYMDVDMRIRGRIDVVWDILDGWDMCAVPNGSHTRLSAMRHIVELADDREDGMEEKNVTFSECGDWPFLGWQGGFIGFNKNGRTERFFEAWRKEWKRFENQDQAAMIRAYRKAPVRMYPLGQAFNGGCLVQHLHSAARRRGLPGSLV